MTMTLVGTPAQVDGGEYNLKADVFSFALTALEVLSGEELYIATQIRSREGGVESRFAIYCTGWRPEIPPAIAEREPELASLFTECMLRDPAARPGFIQIVERLAPTLERADAALSEMSVATAEHCGANETRGASETSPTVAGGALHTLAEGEELFIGSGTTDAPTASGRAHRTPATAADGAVSRQRSATFRAKRGSMMGLAEEGRFEEVHKISIAAAERRDREIKEARDKNRKRIEQRCKQRTERRLQKDADKEDGDKIPAKSLPEKQP